MEYVETKMNCSLVERTHRNSTTRQLCKSEKDLQNYFHIMMSIYQKENEYTNTDAFLVATEIQNGQARFINRLQHHHI